MSTPPFETRDVLGDARSTVTGLPLAGTIDGRPAFVRRAAKAGVLALASALAGATAVELLRAIDVHPAGVLLLSLAFASGSLAAGASLVFVFWVERRLRDMHHELRESARQLSALIAVRPLTGELPLALGGWAIDPVFAELVTEAIVRERPHVIVECGSGSSTVLIAKCLRALGGGRVLSLEHDLHYAEATRALLQLHGVSEWAEVVHAPLVPHAVADETLTWYDVDPAQFTRGGIDLLLVDGPPAVEQQMSRYPAVPLLHRYLSKNCLIVMDDGDREGERRIAELWASELSATREYVPGGKGAWLLRSGMALPPASSPSERLAAPTRRPGAEHEVRASF